MIAAENRYLDCGAGSQAAEWWEMCRGYLLTQVAGGVWADKFGGKPILGFGVVWWSVATACTPIAAQMGLVPLLIVRACMGIGEGARLHTWCPTHLAVMKGPMDDIAEHDSSATGCGLTLWQSWSG